MNRADEFSRRRSSGIILGSRSGRRRTIGVPTPFVRSSGRIEYDDSPIGVAAALAIGHVNLIGGAIDSRLSRGTERVGVVDASCLAAASEIEQEFSGSRNFR